MVVKIFYFWPQTNFLEVSSLCLVYTLDARGPGSSLHLQLPYLPTDIILTLFLFLNWSIVDLPHCVHFWCTEKWFSFYTMDLIYIIYISSVQFSHSVISDSLRPHESQHTRPPCPSPTPGVYRNPCSSSWRCHPAISSSVVPFSSCPQSLPASGFFQWVNPFHRVAKVLEFQLQHQSFQWISRTGLL